MLSEYTLHNEILFGFLPSLLTVFGEERGQRRKRKRSEGFEGLSVWEKDKYVRIGREDISKPCWERWVNKFYILHMRHLPTIIANVLAAFVSIRNLRTWTFIPLDVLFPAFLWELWGEFPFRESLKILWQSVELLCLSAIGSFEQEDDIKEAWLEDVVDIVGLPMCSVDG